MRAIRFAQAPILLSMLLLSWPASAAPSLKICSKGDKVFAAKKCAKGAKAVTLSGLAGEDGTVAVYGDGSAGPATFASGFQSFLTDPPAGNNLQFTTFTVPAATTLSIPSGTIIRCTDSATIEGYLLVDAPSNGGRASGGAAASAVVGGATQSPGAGISLRPATVGEAAHPNAGSSFLVGGFGGEGLLSGQSGDAGRFIASLLRAPHLSGGGGAAPSGSGSLASSEGGRGGGSVFIIAKKKITISGTISAEGYDPSSFIIHGAGGGGGGVVVLAAGEAIEFSGSGSVRANGSDGDQSGSSTGPGGGGGGGLIQYISPSVPTIDSSNSQVAGGAAGASIASGITATALRQGGGGGGGSAGSGGAGGGVPEGSGTKTAYSASQGSDGIAAAIVADPVTLLMGP